MRPPLAALLLLLALLAAGSARAYNCWEDNACCAQGNGFIYACCQYVEGNSAFVPKSLAYTPIFVNSQTQVMPQFTWDSNFIWSNCNMGTCTCDPPPSCVLLGNYYSWERGKLPCFDRSFALNVVQYTQSGSGPLNGGFTRTVSSIPETQFLYSDSTVYPGGYYRFRVGTNRLGNWATRWPNWSKTPPYWNTQYSPYSGLFCIPGPPMAAPQITYPGYNSFIPRSSPTSFQFILLQSQQVGLNCGFNNPAVGYYVLLIPSTYSGTDYGQFVVNTSPLTAGTYTYSVPTAGVYNWIVAYSNGALTTASASSIINVCGLSQPQAVSPNSGVSFNYYPGSQPTITLSWLAAVPTACPSQTVLYSLVVQGVGTFTTTATSYTLPTINDGTYSWMVFGGVSGINSPTSASRTFRRCMYVTPTPVALASPANGFSTASTAITFTWSTAPPFSFGSTCDQEANNRLVFTFGQGSNTTQITLASSGPVPTSYTVSNLAVGLYTWNVQTVNSIGSAVTTSWSFVIVAPTPTPSATASFTQSATATLSFTQSATQSATRSATASFTQSATASHTQSATDTATWTPIAAQSTSTPTATVASFSGMLSSTAAVTLSASATWTYTATDTYTDTDTDTATDTASITRTSTPTPSATASATDTQMAPVTATPTATIVPSASPSPTQPACDLATAPSSPQLTDPADGVTLQTRMVALSWFLQSTGFVCAPGAESFHLSVASDPAGDFALEIDLPSSTQSYTLDDLPSGAYTWTVSYTNAAGLSATSGLGTFSVCISSDLSAPQILGPSNNTVSLSLPTLSWSDAIPDQLCGVDPAAYRIDYLVQASCVLDCKPGASVGLYVSNELSVTLPLDGQAGLWSIQVTAFSSQSPSSQSNTILFRLCIPNSPSAPSLSSPNNYQLNLQPSLQLIWQPSTWESLAACAAFTASYQITVEIDTTRDFSSGAPQTVLQVNRTSFANLPNNVPWTTTAAGSYFWRVTFIKWMAQGSVPSYSRVSVVNTFTVCRSSSPVVPVLNGPNNRTLDITNTTLQLSWLSANYDEFGVICPYESVSLFNPHATLFLSTRNPPYLDPPLDTFVWTTNQTPDLSPLVVKNVTYYWMISFGNGLLSSNSTIGSFDVTYEGERVWNTDAPTFPPTQPPNPTCPPEGCDQTASGFPPGAIAGVIVGVAVLLALCFLLAFIWWRRRNEPADKGELERLESMLEMEPTRDDALNAYVVPPHVLSLYNSHGALYNIRDKKVWIDFEELVVARDFKLPFLLLQAVENTDDADLVTKSLVYLFQVHGYADDLIRFLISREIRKAEKDNVLEASTLFRANSFASAAFTAYCRVEGLEYLVATLRPFHVEIIRNHEKLRIEEEKKARLENRNHDSNVVIQTKASRNQLFQSSFELDPNRLDNQDDALVNKLALELACQRLMTCILQSENYFPIRLRTIMHHVRETITARFPTAAPAAIGGFIFLRLINPAIITPASFGLLPQDPDSSVKRQLVLVTKVLQNLANGTSFKEAFMKGMNEFIDANRPAMERFFQEISNKPTIPSPAPLPVPDHVHYFSLAALHGILFRIKPKIMTVLDEEVRVRPEQAHGIRTRFVDVMEELGTPLRMEAPAGTQ